MWEERFLAEKKRRATLPTAPIALSEDISHITHTVQSVVEFVQEKRAKMSRKTQLTWLLQEEREHKPLISTQRYKDVQVTKVTS